jgi:hypothetical protein
VQSNESESVTQLSKVTKEPDLALVAIPYRGQWFYLADNDLESKSTFMLLTQLFHLQAEAAKAAGAYVNLISALNCGFLRCIMLTITMISRQTLQIQLTSRKEKP